MQVRPRRPYSIPRCRVKSCSTKDAGFICRVGHHITTCRDWAVRTDGGRRPNCRIKCPRKCINHLPRAPTDSTGKRHCNACALRVASCKADFAFHGPVKNGPPSPGARCSTKGSLLGPTLCASVLTCVISDFGFPAADGPNSGTCKTVKLPLPTCTFDVCTASGAAKLCETVNTKDVTTCGAWATRSDGNAQPNCRKPCPRNCTRNLPNITTDNTGKKYCNACVLRVASCEANFAFYGPVNADPLPLPPQTGPGKCSTSPSMVVGAPPSGPSCPRGETCVLSDFGLLVADRPNSGMCKILEMSVQTCSFDLCTASGALSVCKTPDTGDVTTCSA